LRLLTANDGVAPNNEDTLKRLKEKHPPPPSDAVMDNTSSRECFSVTAEEVLKGIESFPSGSSGGIDNMTAQHLKDLFIHTDESPDKSTRLSMLSNFINLLLSGNIPTVFKPILFSARLIALKKKDNGVRPIAISCILRRLAAKLVASKGSFVLKNIFDKTQFGICSKSGCETAIHRTRFFHKENLKHAILKIDFANAFNSLRRDQMIKMVRSHLSPALNFVLSAYASPSFLCFNDQVIPSAEGVQQGDPLGPLLFCLTLQPIINQMSSPLNVWYMDDGTLGGTLEEVKADFQLLESESKKIGLAVNVNKCEILNSGQCPIFSTMRQLSPSTLTLLGAPITEEAKKQCLVEVKENLQKALSRLEIIPAHFAFKVINASFGSPKLIALLRSSPCADDAALIEIDNMIQDNCKKLFNVQINSDNRVQFSLPMRFGGVGIRSVQSIALPAFIASMFAASETFSVLLEDNTLQSYTDKWKQITDKTEIPKTQRQLDNAINEVCLQDLLHNLSPKDKSRLISATHPNSSDWLKATPNTNCGIFLNNEEFQTALGLRLGSPLFEPHPCKCGAMIESSGDHSFACKKNNGKILRHNMVNKTFSNTLKSCDLPNIMEPNYIAENLRPDGLTIIPFSRGQCLTWDVSCPHPLCSSNISSNTTEKNLATRKEEQKEAKYKSLLEKYIFAPIIIDTIGAYGQKTEVLIRAIAKRLHCKTGSTVAGQHFRERLSISVQKGNYLALSFAHLNY